jgi:xylose isomerase
MDLTTTRDNLMKPYFETISPVQFEGKTTNNPLAYRYYDAKKVILGKTMEEHLRLAVCFWHTFCWSGHDIFGENTFSRPWLHANNSMELADARVKAAFEFVEKLGLRYFTFHDRDIAPEGKNLRESMSNLQTIADTIAAEMERTKIKLLWGTANLFSNRRYLAGAATNPNPEVFAYAVTQVKQAMDITKQLNGSSYVLWGGREGYDTLLNTDLQQELNQLARFLSMLVDYKHKIGFTGTLLIEPKPCEPSKHQYDYDTATVFAFLQKYGLEKEFKVNIEANHATLAGHSFAHEVAYAYANDMFGSIDANQGDPQLGWDTDQFPTHLSEMVQVLYQIVKNGGFKDGGFNFDTKLRRQSIDLIDMFYGHISGIDTLARSLEIAASLMESGDMEQFTIERYKDWKQPFGKSILENKTDFEKIAQHVLQEELDPQPISGRQEMLESMMNNVL